MNTKKQKYYVVWNGRNTGIFDTWELCKNSIDGFVGAQYKSFETISEAEWAMKQKPEKILYAKNSTTKTSEIIPDFEVNSICVDGSWNTKTGFIEYRGVYVATREQIFLKGPYADGTNNIAEFLGLVHALAYCKKNNLSLPIYSDSKTAISWVKNKLAKTNHKPTNENQELFELLQRAELWLRNNTWQNRILKWETEHWGENPADFGRK